MNRFLSYVRIKFSRALLAYKREEISLSESYNSLNTKQIARFYTLKFTNRFVSYFSSSFLVHWFFWGLLLAMLGFIKISATDTQAMLKQRAQMPIIELYDYRIYDADKNYVKANLEGQKALRFDEYEIGYETILSIAGEKNAAGGKQAKSIAYIYGAELRRVDDEYFFDKGGVYAKDSGESFWSKKGIYDLKNGVFRGIGEFWAVSLNGTSNGENIIYKQKEGTMNAQNVQARIYLDNYTNKEAKGK